MYGKLLNISRLAVNLYHLIIELVSYFHILLWFETTAWCTLMTRERILKINIKQGIQFITVARLLAFGYSSVLKREEQLCIVNLQTLRGQGNREYPDNREQ